jgi:hypothetical protein
LLALTLALGARGYRYSVLADELMGQEAQVFQEIFPNRAVPIVIRSRLESELTQLRGVRGDTKDLPHIPLALPLVAELLEAMPADRRFRLEEIRVEDGQLYLDGEVREHSDAEAIAELLRTRGFKLPSPHTHRLDQKRVSFRITGDYAGGRRDEIAQRGAP